MQCTTAAELHGRNLVAIVTGAPAGLSLQGDAISADLGRWAACLDGACPTRAAIISGVRDGRTTGAPISIVIDNASAASASADASSCVPRPGTADLVASLAFDADDCSAAAERRPQSECLIRIAAAAVAREFLADMGVDIHSYVTRIGAVAMREPERDFEDLRYAPLDIETSDVRCPSAQATRLMQEAVLDARSAGETLGGEFALVVSGMPAGLGAGAGMGVAGASASSRLAAALFCVPDVTGVSFGRGAQASNGLGSRAHDAFVADPARGFVRTTNVAGGIEGGLTSGMPIVLRATVAPNASVAAKVASIDMQTLAAARVAASAYEPCMVPSLAVAAEAEVAFAMANLLQETFGGASMADVHAAHKAYLQRLKLAAR